MLLTSEDSGATQPRVWSPPIGGEAEALPEWIETWDGGDPKHVRVQSRQGNWRG